MSPEVFGRALLTVLNAEHAEWRPLLAILEEALLEIERPAWAHSVPALERSGSDSEPLLSGTVITLAPRVIGRWIRRVMAIAAGGAREEPRIAALAAARLDTRALFEAAVAKEVDRLDELAHVARDNRGVLRVLAPMIAMPMLHACRRAWADRLPTDWAYGYCPICGGWPALAEIRGLDGSRHLRCGGCGGDWRTEWLLCPFCGERDHENLGSLVSPASLEHQKIEVCDACGAYLKTITTLTPAPPAHVALHDLATLVLDVAAHEKGYHRPTARGPLAVSVVVQPSPLRALLRLRS